MFNKLFTGRMLTVLLFTILSVAGIGFSVYLFYVASGLYGYLLACAFTVLSLTAGFFNIYASIWYYRSFYYDKYLEDIRSGLKPITSYPTVAVVVPVFNEEIEMVDKNMAELKKLNYPKNKLKFYMADDSNDESIKNAMSKICRKYGFSFIHRDERKGYKAGALTNVTLNHSKEDFVVIFDADEFVTDKNIIMDLLPFFQDEKLAYVQTEKRYAKESFFSDTVDIFDAFFFKFIQPARAMNNTAVFAGSCALLRRKAIEHIGGFPEYVIEDTFFSFESDAHGWKSLYVPKVYALGRPVRTFTELAHMQWRYNYGDTQFISYFFKKRGFLSKRSPFSFTDYLTHGFGLNYISVVLILFTLISVGIVFSAVPFAHINLLTFLTQNQVQQDLEVLGFFAFTLSLLTPAVLTKIYFGSWKQGFMVFLLNYALAIVRTKAAIATFFKKNPGIRWNRLKIKERSLQKSLGLTLSNTKFEIGFAAVMFGLAYIALSQTNISGGIWLSWYGILYGLAAVFLHKYG